MPKKNYRSKIFSGGSDVNSIDKSPSLKHSKTKKIISILLLIVLIILVIALGVYLYRRFFSNDAIIGLKINKVIPYIHDGKMPKKIRAGLVPVSSQGNEFSYNFWIYVNDYTYKYNEDKCILYKGMETDQMSANPGIWLLKKTNTLRVNIGTQTEPTDTVSDINDVLDEGSTNLGCANDSDITKKSSCDIKNFPLQRWVNVNVSLHNQTLDIYLDGKLEKSCILTGAPNLNKGNLHLSANGGYNGYISNLQVSNRALNSEHVYDIYTKGPKIKPGLFG